jgi:hypothetical protein
VDTLGGWTCVTLAGCGKVERHGTTGANCGEPVTAVDDHNHNHNHNRLDAFVLGFSGKGNHVTQKGVFSHSEWLKTFHY